MSRLRSDRPTRSAVLAAGLVLGATACVDAGAPGVDVQALEASVVFAAEVPEAERPVVPPSVGVAPRQPGQRPVFGDGTLTIPFRNRIPPRFGRVPISVPPGTSSCARAPLGASPDQAAPENVAGPPEIGLYRWKRDLLIEQTAEGIEVKTPVKGFESRIIRGVEDFGAGTNPVSDAEGTRFSYEVVRPALSGQAVVESWLVNSDPVSSGANVSQDPSGVVATGEGILNENGVPVDVPDEAQEQLPGGNRVRTGEPNRGIVFQGETYFDGNGVEQGSFNPSPPLLFLPLPVQVGDSWVSTGVDPRSGESRRVQGRVAARKAVDACGTLIDGWQVDLTIEAASALGSATRTMQAVVSTEAGGIVIGEEYVETAPDVRLTAKYGIGQVDPSPIPAGAE